MSEDYMRMVTCPGCGGLMVEGKPCRRCVENAEKARIDRQEQERAAEDFGAAEAAGHRDTATEADGTQEKPDPTHGNRSAGRTVLVVIGLLVVGILVVGAVNLSEEQGGSSEADGGESPFIGEEGVLWLDKSMVVPIAVSEPAYEELTELMTAGDNYGIRQLVDAGFVHEIERGTGILLLDISMFKKRVRVLEGPYAGEAGWTPYTWVRQAAPPRKW